MAHRSCLCWKNLAHLALSICCCHFAQWANYLYWNLWSEPIYLRNDQGSVLTTEKISVLWPNFLFSEMILKIDMFMTLGMWYMTFGMWYIAEYVSYHDRSQILALSKIIRLKSHNPVHTSDHLAIAHWGCQKLSIFKCSKVLIIFDKTFLRSYIQTLSAKPVDQDI